MKTKISFVVALLFLLSFRALPQDTIQDPYLKIKVFSTTEIGLSSLQINGNYNKFGNYTLFRDRNYVTYEFGFFHTITNIFNKPYYIANIKTGLLFKNNYTDLTDSSGKELTFSELCFALPVMFGIRLPVNYNRPQDRFYKAVNINVGGYVGLPMIPILAEKGVYSNDFKYFIGDYIKFGMISEFEFTALNKRGKGHRIGLRSMIDLSSIIFKNSQKYGIQPVYISQSIYYNIMTDD